VFHACCSADHPPHIVHVHIRASLLRLLIHLAYGDQGRKFELIA